MIKDRGDTINLKATVKDYNGDLYDPDTSMKISITAPSGTAAVTAQDMTPGTTGIYTYAWLSLAASELGNYTVSYTAVDSVNGTEIQYDSFTLAIVSTTGDVIDDLVDRVGVVLEDPSFAIFDDATAIPQAIQQAVNTVSKVVPYEVKETVTLTASSTDVDVSAISNLIKVLKAEYKISQTPKEFRNVSRFGDTLTIETDLVPATGDTAYLFCLKRHSVDDSGSTLTPELEDIVVELAASYIALNWVGEGRTQIMAAKSTVSDVSASIDSMTTDISQAITDLATVRTNLATMLTTSQAAIDLGNAQNDLAVTDLASVRTNLATMLTTIQAAIDLGSAQNDLAVTDLASVRTNLDTMLSTVQTAIDLAKTELDMGSDDIADAKTAFKTAADLTAIDTAIALITARVAQAVTDLGNGRALINTITTEGNAVANYANYGVGELNAATGRLNEARAFMQKGSNLAGQLQNTANHEVNLANSYLSQAHATLTKHIQNIGQLGSTASREVSVANGYLAEAHATLSKWAQDISQLGSTASREVSIANGYLGEAHATLSKWAQDIGQLGATASRELSIANSHLSQASGYAREINSRISVANVISSYQKWAQTKYQIALGQLRKIQEPRTYHTFSRS